MDSHLRAVTILVSGSNLAQSILHLKHRCCMCEVLTQYHSLLIVYCEHTLVCLLAVSTSDILGDSEGVIQTQESAGASRHVPLIPFNLGLDSLKPGPAQVLRARDGRLGKAFGAKLLKLGGGCLGG